jgi:hypothetical protein
VVNDNKTLEINMKVEDEKLLKKAQAHALDVCFS